MANARAQPQTGISIPHRSWRELVLFLGLVGAVIVPRMSEDGHSSGGCDNDKAAHAGIAGTLGGGVLLAKVCSQGDNVARIGARIGDDALQLGADAARVGNSASKGLDSAIGATKLDAVYNNHWEDAAEIIGRLASDSDIEKYPGYWKDAGVELYMSNPQRWAELGGDDLLAMAAVRSPAMREGVKKAAKKRFDRSLSYLAGVENVGPRTIARVKERYGVDVIEGAAESYKLELRTADYLYKLLDDLVMEEPISDRATFTAEKAEALLAAEIGGILVPEPRSNVAGLYCIRRKDLEKREFPAYWVGPDVILRSTDPDDFDRLVSLIGADRSPDHPEVFAELWVVFHEPIFSGVCTKERRPWMRDRIDDPSAKTSDDGLVYRFYSARSAEDCQAREVRVLRRPVEGAKSSLSESDK